MDTRRLLELYDREERLEKVWAGMRREITPHVIRQLDRPGRESFINHSFLDAESADDAISEQISFFEGRGQTFEWKAHSHDRPPDLTERLRERGFEVGEAEAIMALELAHAPEVLLRPVKHDVRRVNGMEGIADVVRVQDDVWPDNRSYLAEQLGEELRATPERISIYVAYVDGVPAASAWVRFPEPGGSFASLWAGSTVARYRGLGLYAALLGVRVQETVERGVPFLTIDAGPMSRPIVEKFGFQTLTFAYACRWRVGAATDERGK